MTAQVQVGIERGAEAMDKGHRPEACCFRRTGTSSLEPVLDRIQKYP